MSGQATALHSRDSRVGLSDGPRLLEGQAIFQTMLPLTGKRGQTLAWSDKLVFLSLFTPM